MVMSITQQTEIFSLWLLASGAFGGPVLIMLWGTPEAAAIIFRSTGEKIPVLLSHHGNNDSRSREQAGLYWPQTTAVIATAVFEFLYQIPSLLTQKKAKLLMMSRTKPT